MSEIASPKTPKLPHPADLLPPDAEVGDEIILELENLELELKSKESYLLRLIDRQQKLDGSKKLTQEVKTEIAIAADPLIGLLVAREVLQSNFDNYFFQQMQKWDDSLAAAGFGIINANSSADADTDTTAETLNNEKRALFFDEMERHICTGLRDLRKTFVYDCY